MPLGVESSLERRTSVRSAVPAVLARYLRRRKRSFCINVGRDGGGGVGVASGCGVGWLAVVEEGIVVDSGCESSIVSMRALDATLKGDLEASGKECRCYRALMVLSINGKNISHERV